MTFTNKFKAIKKFYTIIFITILFFNTLLVSKLNANILKINDIEVSEIFDLNFNKKKVFDKAFIKAYKQLISKAIISEDRKKLEKIDLLKIKSLIDTFIISDETFIENKYHVKVNVNFNKKNVYKYFESQNIFPALPNNLDLLILPILINNNENEIVYFTENIIYKNWNNHVEQHHLLNYVLPTEDIEDIQIIKNKIEFIEKYNFEEIMKKYGMENSIILIINQNLNEINVLSKMQFNNNKKIFNSTYKIFDLNDELLLSKLILDLKKLYEDEWKKLNLINTSIKLPLTISLSSKDYDKIELFEETLEDLDLVSSFSIKYFNNNNIFYKVIYNGSPGKFFGEIKESGLKIKKNNQSWRIQ